MPEMMSMPEPRKILAAAPTLAPDDPLHLVAFACEPAWLEANAPADGKPALPRFSMVAYTGGPMRLAGWRHPVIVDLAGLRIPTQHRPIRLGHDAGQGVGHTDSIRVEGGKLVAAGIVSRDTAAAREVVVSSKNGFPWQASIGAAVEEHEFVREGQTVQVNGQTFPGPVNVVRRASLGEISFVDLGADGNTSAAITAIHTASGVAPMTQPAAAAPAASTPTPAAIEPAAPAAQASATPVPAPVQAAAVPDPVAQMRAAAAAETERIAAVRGLAAGHPGLEAKAIKEGWDTQRTELEVLRASRPQAPAIHVRDDEITAAVLEAGCIQAGRLDEPEKLCDPKALETANRRFRGRLSLQRLIMEAAWANGCTVRVFKDDPRAVLLAAWGGQVQAALSHVDLPGIFSNVANKFLLAGFGSAESTWRNICRVSPVSDFKQITRYRLVGNMTYERVAPGGELKHGKLGEEKFTNQADTHGLMVAIDRRDIINDDLGVITSVPQELGRGAAQSLNDLFWAAFLDHAAFFAAGNKNLLTGADTALTIDGLTKAEVLFNQQVDGSGRPLGIAPAILLVPTALAAVGTALTKAGEIRDNSAANKYPTFNIHQGKYRLEMSRFLDNPKIPGGSAKAWYLLAEPADLAAIEVVFLNGQESPTIESTDADFSTLGIQLRGYHDFGVAKQDPRAAVKAAGV
jgi:phage major head subunit gpT-like protein